MMKWPILFAALAIAAPATAQTKVDEKVGAWSISGEKGDCLAFFGTPHGMVMIASPASNGENHGGIMFAQPGLAEDPAQNTMISLVGPSIFNGPMVVRPMEDTDPPIFWRAFPSATTIDAFPDIWQVRMTRGGAVLAEVKVSGFVAARASLRSCVEKTR